MAVTIKEVYKSVRNAGNTASIIVADLLCDTAADLPSQSSLTGYVLAQGCKADVISENKTYKIDSAGNWHVSGGEMWQNVYTKSEVDNLLDDKQDELTTAQLAAVNSGITAEKLTADEVALAEIVDKGAKNLANWIANTSTISGVTFTINDDKTISTSGTATARSQKPLYFMVPSTLKAGRYVLSGCPNGGEQSGKILYCIYIWDATANVRVASGDDTGTGLEFDWVPDASHRYSISVDVRGGTNASGLIFKPMICTKAEWGVSNTYVPYAPTNRELYEMIIALQ